MEILEKKIKILKIKKWVGKNIKLYGTLFTPERRFYFYVDGMVNQMTADQLCSVFQPYGKHIRCLPFAEKYFTFLDMVTTEPEAQSRF